MSWVSYWFGKDLGDAREFAGKKGGHISRDEKGDIIVKVWKRPRGMSEEDEAWIRHD